MEQNVFFLMLLFFASSDHEICLPPWSYSIVHRVDRGFGLCLPAWRLPMDPPRECVGFRFPEGVASGGAP